MRIMELQEVIVPAYFIPGGSLVKNNAILLIFGTGLLKPMSHKYFVKFREGFYKYFDKKECAKAHSRAGRGRLRQSTSSRKCASQVR